MGKKYEGKVFISSLVVVAAILVMLFFMESIWSTLLIFIFSLLAFHAILFRYAKHEKVWKSTDYVFEMVAILSIIAAVSGLIEAGKQKQFQEEFAKRKLAQVKFIYAVESTIINDCDPLDSRAGIWDVTPEPIKGECDRIKHILPQMKFDFDQETGPENMTADDNWAFNLEYKGYNLRGSWEGIQNSAKQFLGLSEHTQKIISLRDADKDKIITLSKIDKVVYWHNILAFLLALKISRISMEIFKK